MTVQTEDNEPPFIPDIGEGPKLAAPSKTAVRLAGATIAILAVVGLARGVTVGRPAGQQTSPLAVLAGVSPETIASAKPANVLPKDDGWSTLSGPRLLDASDKPKVQAKVAASDDDADDSDSPAAQTAAADAIAPDAPDAAPATPAASSTATPEPAPQAL
jgi:hypothetical protein